MWKFVGNFFKRVKMIFFYLLPFSLSFQSKFYLTSWTFLHYFKIINFFSATPCTSLSWGWLVYWQTTPKIAILDNTKLPKILLDHLEEENNVGSIHSILNFWLLYLQMFINSLPTANKCVKKNSSQKELSGREGKEWEGKQLTGQRWGRPKARPRWWLWPRSCSWPPCISFFQC